MGIAVMLGGPDGRTLFALTAESTDRDETQKLASARIEIARVDVPHAGMP